MSIGLYQSAASLSALERWQAVVAQNITSSQVTGYRKRTIDFSSEMAGELQTDPRHAVGRGDLLFATACSSGEKPSRISMGV